MLVAVSPPCYGELPPPETVFSEAFVSPNGAWNILNMIRNSNKMNNTCSQPARAFDEALNENTEPHQRVIKANIWKCQRQMSNPAEADEWAASSVGISWACCYLSNSRPPSQDTIRAGEGWECQHAHSPA